MAFIAGIIVTGGALIYAYDDHSRHSDYTRHSEYGDSSMCNEISNKESEISRQETNIENRRQQMNDNFNSRVAELKREKNYSGLDSPPSQIIAAVKQDMSRELNAEISRDKQELAEIDKMIARINELELQAKR